MGLLIVGSVALDDVETPFGKVEAALGGSATFISVTASYFTAPVHVVGVVGEDFGDNILEFENRNIDIEGLQVIKGGKTFHWSGKYHYDLNVRDTLATDLNVFEFFDPVIPEKYVNDRFVILGNIQPSLQMKVLDRLNKPSFVVCDTMNLWIDIAKDDLIKVFGRSDVVIINDSEARLLTNEPNLIKAAKIVLGMGPKYVIIKKGEHGALLFSEDTIFSAPAYPLENIFDPTGAGDTFAGGFTAYLHKTGDLSFENMKKAVIYGSAMASFCVEKFSIAGIADLNNLMISDRYAEFKKLSEF